MSILRAAGLGVATLVATVGVGQSAAEAGWWCSSSYPLKVYDDGVASGAAYGHYVEVARADRHLRDPRLGQRPVQREDHRDL
jgi:hypothetical protein